MVIDVGQLCWVGKDGFFFFGLLGLSYDQIILDGNWKSYYHIMFICNFRNEIRFNKLKVNYILLL